MIDKWRGKEIVGKSKIKTITDTFIIKIGQVIGTFSHDFICEEKRKGAKHEEPFDVHDIGRWIIKELGLEKYKTYEIEVVVRCKGEKKMSETETIINNLYSEERGEQMLNFYVTMNYKDLPKISWRKKK